MSENTLENIIFGLKEELKQSKERYIKILDLNERMISSQQAKIERLTEEKDKYQEKWQTSYMNELNLQKQVDKLKAENKKLHKEHTILIAGSILAKQNIAKDTAKEICDLILEHEENKQFVECDWLRVAIAEKYGVDVE